jgi:hypothetical protein
MRRVLLLHMLLELLLTPASTTQAPALVVTLRDTDGQGVPGVTVEVRDIDGGALAHATTDGAGEALFATLPHGSVRVAVTGRMGGVALRQTGQDSEGVLLMGDGPACVLDLRVAPDGQVIPDPASMIAPDPASPSLAPGVGIPPRSGDADVTAVAQAATPTHAEPAADAPSSEPGSPVPVLLLALSGSLLGLVFLMWRWGRAS